MHLKQNKLYQIPFLRKGLFTFREGKGKREGEKHQCVVASRVPPAGDLPCNPGMCPSLGIEPLIRRPALNPLHHNSQGSLPNSLTEGRKTPCLELIMSYLTETLNISFNLLTYSQREKKKNRISK